MHFTGNTCPGVSSTIANGRYITLQGDAATSSTPAVGTVWAVTCNAGYEQTGGLPYYACRVENETTSWSGELLNAPPLCERKYLNTITM